MLILEDDVELCDDFDEKFNATVSHLPADWHALWLNGSDAKPLELYDAHLFKLISCFGTFAYLVNHTFYDVLIEGFSKQNLSSDEFTKLIQHQYNCYRPVYPLAYHRNGYSVRLEKKVHYPSLTKPKR